MWFFNKNTKQMSYKLTLYFIIFIIIYNKLLLIAWIIKNQVKYVTHVKVRTQIKCNCPQLSWVWTMSRLLTYLLLITKHCTAFVSDSLVTASPLHNAQSAQSALQCPVSICAGAWRQAGVTSPEGAVRQVCVSWKQKMTIMRSDIDTLIQHEPLPADGNNQKREKSVAIE
mgnify:CR=1 FL=1